MYLVVVFHLSFVKLVSLICFIFPSSSSFSFILFVLHFFCVLLKYECVCLDEVTTLNFKRVCWFFVRCHFAAVAAVVLVAVVVSFHFFPYAELPHAVRPFHDRILYLHNRRGVVQFVLLNRVQCQYLLRHLQILHSFFGYEFDVQRCGVVGGSVSVLVVWCVFVCVRDR